jgi:hypothetical protein
VNRVETLKLEMRAVQFVASGEDATHLAQELADTAAKHDQVVITLLLDGLDGLPRYIVGGEESLMNEPATPKIRRRRRTREEIEAEEAGEN